MAHLSGKLQLCLKNLFQQDWSATLDYAQATNTKWVPLSKHIPVKNALRNHNWGKSAEMAPYPHSSKDLGQK